MSNSSQNKISLDERIKIINKHPIFSLLTKDDIQTLAQLLKETTKEPNSIIVKEGESVNSLFFIAKGSAKVTKTIKTVGHMEIMHIADLIEGDAIGIAEDNLFSHSGRRTATVTSLTPMVLLYLDLKVFIDFLKNPNIIYPGLRKVCEKILVMNLKQKKIPHEKKRGGFLKKLTKPFLSIGKSKKEKKKP